MPQMGRMSKAKGVANEIFPALASVAQLVGALSCKPKGCGFDPQSGHIPRLRVQSPVRVSARGN